MSHFWEKLLLSEILNNYLILERGGYLAKHYFSMSFNILTEETDTYYRLQLFLLGSIYFFRILKENFEKVSSKPRTGALPVT